MLNPIHADDEVLFGEVPCIVMRSPDGEYENPKASAWDVIILREASDASWTPLHAYRKELA